MFLIQQANVRARQLYDIDGEFFEDNTLSVYIKRLRQKLGEDGAYIETVRGMGYRFRK